MVLSVQASKERGVALKKLFQRVQKQAFTETPRTGKKVVFALIDKLQGKGGFIDIVIGLVLAYFTKSLNADGQFFALYMVVRFVALLIPRFGSSSFLEPCPCSLYLCATAGGSAYSSAWWITLQA